MIQKIAFCFILVLILLNGPAVAQVLPVEPADICTDGPQFKTDIPDGQSAVVTKISEKVEGMAQGLGQYIFNKIQGKNSFKSAVSAAAILYIALYGMFFMTGGIRASAYDMVIRITKVSVIAILVNSNAWGFFSPYVSDFFNDATDEFMDQVATITIGGQPSGKDNFPMQIIDQAIAKIINVNMGVHLLAMFFSPPYGLFYLVLTVVALWSLIGLLFIGVWVYLTSLIFRGLLIGVAPLFIACILFTKTRHLFDGWLNQLLSSCLQPIMLFTFLSFFVLMVINGGYVDKILDAPVCWTEANEAVEGSPFNVHFWRFAEKSSSGKWKRGFEPYSASGSTIPIEIIPLITFLILAEIGKRFSQVVLMVARDITASSVDLSDAKSLVSNLMPSTMSAPVSGADAKAASDMKAEAVKDGPVQAVVRNIANSLRSR